MNGPRAHREFWASPHEAELTEAVVHDNPRKTGEGPLQYIERIAVLAGLMPASRAGFIENTKLGPQEPALSGVRLPYREPGDDE